MSLSDLRGLLLRRWYLVIVGLTGTAALVVLATRLVPADFEAKANVLLLPPKLSSGAGGNPFLSLGGLQNMSDVVARSMMDDATVQAVQARGGTDEYVVETDRTTSGPLLLVTVVDSNAATAMRTLKLVVSRLPDELDTLQAADNVEEAFRITSSVVTMQAEPAVDRKSQTRAAVLAAAVGLVGTLLFVSAIDGLLLRRRAKRLLEQPQDQFAVADSGDPDGQKTTGDVGGDRGDVISQRDEGGDESDEADADPPARANRSGEPETATAGGARALSNVGDAAPG